MPSQSKDELEHKGIVGSKSTLLISQAPSGSQTHRGEQLYERFSTKQQPYDLRVDSGNVDMKRGSILQIEPNEPQTYSKYLNPSKIGGGPLQAPGPL